MEMRKRKKENNKGRRERERRNWGRTKGARNKSEKK